MSSIPSRFARIKQEYNRMTPCVESLRARHGTDTHRCSSSCPYASHIAILTSRLHDELQNNKGALGS